MSHDRPLQLSVASRRASGKVYMLLLVLAVLSAALSPHPIELIVLICLVTGLYAWLFSRFPTRSPEQELILIMFPDGRVRLESGSMRVLEGVLDEHHWSTRHAAVVSIRTRIKPRRVMLLARQQDPGNFRRLRVWLRLRLADMQLATPAPGFLPAGGPSGNVS